MRNPFLFLPVLPVSGLANVALAAMAAFGGMAAQAEVLRCADAAGAIVYTDGACPAGTRSSRPVPIAEPPPAPAQPEQQPTQAMPSPASPSAPAPPMAQGGGSPGLSIIPRYSEAEASREAQADPGPVYDWGAEPYGPLPASRWRGHRPVPPRVHDPGPGHRPCAHMAGLRRNNC